MKTTTQSQLLMTLKKMPYEKNVGKRENAGTQHFLLFPPSFLTSQNKFNFFKSHLFYCLQTLSLLTSPKFRRLVFTTKSQLLTTLKKRLYKNNVGKEKCWYPAFSPFPIMFSTFQKQIQFF